MACVCTARVDVPCASRMTGGFHTLWSQSDLQHKTPWTNWLTTKYFMERKGHEYRLNQDVSLVSRMFALSTVSGVFYQEQMKPLAAVE